MVKVNNIISIRYKNNKIKDHIIKHKRNINLDTKEFKINEFEIGDIIFLESGAAVEFNNNLQVIDKTDNHLICDIVVY